MIRTTKEVVKEVTAVIAFLCCLEEVIVLFLILGKIMTFNKNAVTILIGLLVGSIFSVLMFMHMAGSLETTVDMLAEEHARKHNIKMYGLRTLLLLIGIVIAYFTTWVNIIALLIGIMNLKFGVYLQPLMHKVIGNFHNT